MWTTHLRSLISCNRSLINSRFVHKLRWRCTWTSFLSCWVECRKDRFGEARLAGLNKTATLRLRATNSVFFPQSLPELPHTNSSTNAEFTGSPGIPSIPFSCEGCQHLVHHHVQNLHLPIPLTTSASIFAIRSVTKVTLSWQLRTDFKWLDSLRTSSQLGSSRISTTTVAVLAKEIKRVQYKTKPCMHKPEPAVIPIWRTRIMIWHSPAMFCQVVSVVWTLH